MRVSVCLVTRDHAGCVAHAVRSAADVAAEAVVIDAGSTDDTVAVATAAGATVHPFAWADDFAAACNSFLDRATGDWVLWLNPDETVEPAAVPALSAAALDHGAFAFALGVANQYRADGPDLGPAQLQVRLFRRVPGLRFRGRLHPDFDPPVRKLAADRGLAVRPLNATVRRHAYLSPVTPDKVRWANRLIEAELRDRPGQLPLLIELAANLLRLDDPRGHDVMAQAADRVAVAAGADAAPHPRVGAVLEYLLVTPPDRVRATLARADAARLADRWFPHTPPVVWARANERAAAGDDAAAAPLYERLVEMGRTGRFDRAAGFAPDVVGPAAALALAGCLVRLGRGAEAKGWLAPLLAHPAYRDRAVAAFAAAS